MKTFRKITQILLLVLISLKVDDRESYLRLGVPLYEASIRCNWNDAKAILDTKPELVRHSITENGETALHLAASAKCDPKAIVEFVKNLVGMMKEEDLALENVNFSTAFYIATATGNVEVVKIMSEKNKILLTIPGSGRHTMLPLNVAALFGHYEVVKYLYEESRDLIDACWISENRSWLLEKCVENEMFDVALKIVKRYPELGRSWSALKVLARKPEAFRVTKSNIMRTTINTASRFIGLKVKAPQKENAALTLLRFMWKDITKLHTNEIDSILRGPPDSVDQQDNKIVSGWAIQAMQLQKLIYEHVARMEEDTKNILIRSRESTNQTNKKASVNEEQALQLQSLVYERLMNMRAETQKIMKGPLDLIKQDNKPITGKRDQVLKLENLIFKHIVDLHEKINHINTFKMEDDTRLQEAIFEEIKKMGIKTQEIITDREKETYSSRVMFIAAEMGNTKFLVELIHLYPDLIWKVNDDNQSIFHIAVKYRHEGIYSLLYEIGSMKDLITPLKDSNNNNMLHLVGKVTTRRGEAVVSGPVLQMQREVLWFMDVTKMIPPSYKERRNKDGLTPTNLFLNEHGELIKEGEKWMKDMANQCMVAATLIATIAFAAAFTIPGGYNQDNGIPIFYRKPLFAAFLVVDSMSLFLSSTSILSLLSLFTSHYTEFDFVKSLPKKLILGMSTLFASIIAMIITFSLGLFMLCHKEMMWIPILFGVIALTPVLLYSMLQYRMFMDVIRSTFSSRYYFKPKKQSLYNVNPRF